MFSLPQTIVASIQIFLYTEVKSKKFLEIEFHDNQVRIDENKANLCLKIFLELLSQFVKIFGYKL